MTEMGVDAEMLVKIKGRENWLEQDRVTQLCYLLGSTLGHKGMFCYEGDIGESHHFLSIVQPWNAAEHGYYEELDGKISYTQDGDPIIAADDEQFIRVHFFTRYYGVGYERGDWMLIKSTAEFLELHISNCEIWYGGDSSGICASLLDKAAREELHAHFLEHGHRPYRGYFNRGVWPECPMCKVSMTSSGGGADREFVYCQGCGRREVIFKDDGTRRRVPRGKEYFDLQNKADGEPVGIADITAN